MRNLWLLNLGALDNYRGVLLQGWNWTLQVCRSPGTGLDNGLLFLVDFQSVDPYTISHRNLQPCFWRATVLQTSFPALLQHTCLWLSRNPEHLDLQLSRSRVGDPALINNIAHNPLRFGWGFIPELQTRIKRTTNMKDVCVMDSYIASKDY